jgi:hypothetical protein
VIYRGRVPAVASLLGLILTADAAAAAAAPAPYALAYRAVR